MTLLTFSFSQQETYSSRNIFEEILKNNDRQFKNPFPAHQRQMIKFVFLVEGVSNGLLKFSSARKIWPTFARFAHKI